MSFSQGCARIFRVSFWGGDKDAFVLPSLYEGLGLVLVEAQAAGLPCFIAKGVPDESDVVKELVTRLSLAIGPEK